MDRYSSNAAPTGPPVPTKEHFADGGLIYSILCTLSLFLMFVLVIIYYRLNYNRIFVYFCVSIVLIFIPHALGGWIYGAQLARAPTIVCWIQGLWINAASIAGGLTVLVYTYEIYRGIVLHVPDDEYKRRKYYIAVSILFPLLVGFVPPAIIAEKPNGILPAAYFCFLYKPMIPLAFVSVEGWNTLLAIPAIYFSFRTAIEVAKIIYTRRGFDATLVTKSIGQTNSQVTIQTIHSQSQSRISDDVEQSYTPTTAVPTAPDTPHRLSPPLRLSNKTIASIPVY
ncbi:4052_t:CDS:2, partial [Paraglomus occultum]